MSDYLNELFGLKDQVAVVIGGTGVLCGRMAHALAGAGAFVVVAGRNGEKGKERVEAIEAEGGKATFLAVDASSRESIAKLCESVESAHGPVDILINGAGVNSATPYFEIPDDEWDKILGTNLRALHQACQIFGEKMTARGKGSIINVGSVTTDRPLSKVFAYAASKAAVLNYSQNVAREFGSKGVRVNCVSPGFFPAEQNRKILSPERVAKILERTPMGRFGEPHELDGAVLLLASDKAGAFVNGANIFVDGGFTAMSI
ncbi:putative oxidoreductase UxuB [Planctomycetes bacterium Pan216]|uniref:Putative oxidoreductase UxuB n=1 Tax=Kolteria novifilia TaxID=2527975 RepID=A0A518B0P8_9BACT|nr:putative oxidoreductase UxuB [Planctomycetes bacterium Pan216]